MRGTRTLAAVAWGVVVWTALWGDVSVANALGGLAVGLVTVLLVPVAPDRDSHPVAIRPVAAVRFLLFFVRALVVASAVVAWEVVTPRNRINQGIVKLPLRTTSPGLATLVANAISLTPGTLTIEVRREPLTLYVHVLHLREVEAVRADLRRLEARALAAFDPNFREEARS